MEQLIELKPNRLLLDSEFESYRLSLQKLPGYGVTLAKELQLLQLPQHQYSLQHVQTFTSQNYLISDRWNDDIIYFIARDLSVNSLRDSSEESLLKDAVEVFSSDDLQSVSFITSGSGEGGDRYNATLTFPSPGLALLSDGSGQIILLDTGIRTVQQPWKVLSSERKPHGVLLYDSMRIGADSDSSSYISLLTGHVSVDENKKHCTVISNIIYTVDTSTLEWKEKSLEEYKTYNVEYVSLDSDGHIYIASSKRTYTNLDPEDHVDQSVSTTHNISPAEVRQPAYIWLQADEDITVTFSLPAEVTKADVEITFTRDHLTVHVRGRQLLSGDLCRPISSGDCTWTISEENTRLEVYVSKADSSWWTDFIPGDSRGEMITDPEVAERIHQNIDYLTTDVMEEDRSGSKPAVNSQELEECDMLGNDPKFLCKISAKLRKIVYTINLTGCAWLFNFPPSKMEPASFCTRHDVDGLVWGADVSNSDKPYDHVATFNALGYVQASKESRRFISAPPVCSYVAIADTDRHIYIYRQPQPLDTDMRNRKSGRALQHVSVQQLISLDSNESIHGFVTRNQAVYILTRSHLYKHRI